MKEFEIIQKFLIEGEIKSIAPYGEGHINRTLLVQTDKKKYIFQKINTTVFTSPEDVMNNILYVTEHLSKRGILSLTVVKTLDGKPMLREGEDCYRLYDYIDDAVSFQSAETKEIFSNVGYSFGEFQNALDDFDASLLAFTIVDFHNTPKRYQNFLKATSQNSSNRLSTCLEEVNFVNERKNTFSLITDALSDGTVPLRVTHNDTKLNNILMDPETHKGKAVIDLDTVMPGSMLYDFGDAIRFGASTAPEDEKDLSKVHFDISLFKAYAEGFLGAIGDKITEKEKSLLPYSAYLMAMECGMRFLSDYIDGDVYFATKYPEHNLVRCRTQFKLASEMEEKMNEMLEIVKNI